MDENFIETMNYIKKANFADKQINALILVYNIEEIFLKPRKRLYNYFEYWTKKRIVVDHVRGLGLSHGNYFALTFN